MRKIPGLTIAEALGHGPRGRKLKRQREAAEAAAAATAATPPAPPPPQRPTLPDLSMLTLEDRQRVTQAMGVDMPLVDGCIGPQPDATLSRQLAGRYLQDLGRFRAHEAAQRRAELDGTVGKFNAIEANAETVRRRLADLGLESDAVAVSIRERGAPLERRVEERQSDAAQLQADRDREFALDAKRRMAAGERVDFRRATAGQVAALIALGV